MFQIIGVSQFCQFFLSHIAKNHRGRTLLCFRIICYESFSDNRVITILSIVFVSQCRKICGEPFNDSKKLEHLKLLCIIGEFHEFLSKNFSLTRPKNIVGERFVVSKHLGCRKILCERVEGGITILRRFIFCLIFLKNFVGNPSLYDKISGNERFFA